ncbi:endo-1,4-beta-xylanase [Neptunitalea chrysea]|uniref:Endo-1,4-beta-xylanase n=2 Tax=Neptunitalea chrysea TaxID=1647581 RepID=A0A9W6ETR0_9FLAO|nr:endo-1,4-beta-xylanase [Neptunitalea chrysea]
MSYSLFAQTSGVTTMKLWNNNIPNFQTSNSKEEVTNTDYKTIWVSHVQEPSIDVYLPTKRIATGAGVLICPGGGYAGLAYDWEGTDMAKWLNSKGIAAFVLKYRLPGDASVKTSYLAALQDAQRAMKIIKQHAKEWNLTEGQLGVMGFSAGGHLASTLGTQYDREVYASIDNTDKLSAKPDFMILIYPVISMKEGVTHQGSKDNLLGKNPSKDLVLQYSNELNVTKNTPPTFLLHANDDGAVPVKNSLLMYEALTKNNVPVEMHLFPYGGHGFAFGYETAGLSEWTTLCYNWITFLMLKK